MLENLTNNIELPSMKDGIEKAPNLESERPMGGIEQPFSENNLLNEVCSEIYNEEFSFDDSERVQEYLPSEDIREKNVGQVDIETSKSQNDVEQTGNSGDIEEKQDGLTDEEKAELKERTGWPDEVVEVIGSLEEAEVYEKADLKAVEVDGKWCLVREDIAPNQMDEDGITNSERMERGRPPVTKDGKEIELHHVGQKQDSPLAELTMEEHRGAGNDTILHDKTKESEIDRNEFAKERREHWKSRTANMEGE